jgi:3-oxoacyl-[acyl-carrier protein] reductase
VALVTGAARGIGAETARRLAARGHRLALVDLDKPALERIKADLPVAAEAWSAVLDVRDPEAVREMAEAIPARLGPVEILINNVGGNTEAVPVEEILPETFAAVLRLNLDPVYLCTRAFVPAMKARRWGRIVNLASIAGRTRTLFSNAAYAAAKAAVIGFTRQCAAELAPCGIAVNAVAHGPIATERILRAWESKSPERKAAILGAIPAGRMGSIAEAAEAVCFFCGEGAGYAAGSVLDVNGGLFIA